LASETINFGQLMAGIAGALVGGDQASADIAAAAGGHAVANNQFGVASRVLVAAQRVCASHPALCLGAATGAALQAQLSQRASELQQQNPGLSYDRALDVASSEVISRSIVSGAINAWSTAFSGFAGTQPSAAAQAPTGYGAGNIRVVSGPTSTSADVMLGANATATPGTAQTDLGVPGYGAAHPSAADTSTTTPNNGPMGGVIMMATAGSIPQSALDAVDYAAANNGAARPGYVGGRAFSNDGRGGGQVLPTVDASGNPIAYTEYDTNRFVPGINRGAERVVVGADGSAYYTNDHYSTFVRIR
jgi:guanyl-specific ribonuclease Sa